MRPLGSGRKGAGVLALCAAFALGAALPAVADDPPADVVVTSDPTSDPATDPTTDPTTPPPTTDPTTDPTTPPPTTDPTTDPTTPPPTTDPTTDPTTPAPSPTATSPAPTASPSTTPTVVPTPLVSPSTSPTPTSFTTTINPSILTSTSVTTRAVATVTKSPSAITTGGAALMAALIRINTAEAQCAATSATEASVVTIDSSVMPASLGEFHGDALVNAAVVVGVGLELGVPERALAIAVMTAMAESGLQPADQQAPVGPAGVGLFEQGAGGAWGTYEERVDPATSARNFFARLTAVPGWDALDPALAADAVQRGEDPAIYAPYWDDAQQTVQALTTQRVVVSTPRPCVTEFGALNTATTWTNPLKGRITSPFGYRVHPVLGVTAEHWGTDVAAKCGTEIRAAADGIVVWVGGGLQGRTGNQIVVYHGNGILTRYGHVLTGSQTVSVGDAVAAGQVIAGVGGDPRIDPAGAGLSTGCHLHFETNTDNGGTVLNPVTFLADRGVALAKG